jgi:hypothetical protein
MLNKSNHYHLLLFLIVCLGILYTFRETKHPSFSILQTKKDFAIELDKGDSIIQSFVSTEANLSSIRLQVDVKGRTDIPQAPVSLCLMEAESSIEIACDNMLLPGKSDVEEIYFSFPIQPDSLGKPYQISIKTNAPPGVVLLLSSGNDGYPNGNLYINGEEMPGDLAFNGYFRPGLLTLIRLLINSRHRLLLLIEFLGLFFICGYLILNLLSINPIPRTFSQCLILSSCAGMAFPPVLLYALEVLDVRLTRIIIVYILLCLVGLFFLAHIIRLLRGRGRPISTNRLQNNAGVVREFSELTFDNVLQVNQLFVPNWTDGLAHQNAIDGLFANGVIPPGQIYHFGYHLTVFFAESLVDSASPEATLIFGQWLSVATGMSFYALAQKVLGAKGLPLICLAFYWFLSPFPSYLVAWGRYPFLMGMALLPAAILFGMEWVTTRKSGSFLLSVLSALSLLVVHASVFAIWSISLTSLLIFRLLDNRSEFSNEKLRRHSIYRIAAQIGFLILLIVLLILPKVRTIVAFSETCYEGYTSLGLCFSRIGNLSQIFGVPRANSHGLLAATYGNPEKNIDQFREIVTNPDTKYQLGLTFRHGGGILWLCGVVGLAYIFRTKRKMFYRISLWFILIIAVSFLQMMLFDIAVPSPTNIIIFLSVPITLLSGAALQFLSFAPNDSMHFRNINLAAILGLVLVSAYDSIAVVNPATTFFNQKDGEAMTWIRQNTEINDLILINSFYWGNWRLPSDGGGWIRSLTGRNTVFASSQQEFADIQRLINSNNIRYIYLGDGYGELQPSAFGSSKYELVYHKNGVYIFMVLPE